MFDEREYQNLAISKTFEYMVANPKSHPLVAMPTGSGKTAVLSKIIDQAIKNYGVNVLVISHVKEIIEQDTIALQNSIDGIPISVFSAGMKRREIGKITVASIQTIYKSPELFQDFRFIIIDECHLIPPNGTSMYRQFLSNLHSNARYFGLTATPYRLGTGYIWGGEDSIFDELIYDITSKDKFVDLINNGYLCPIRPYAPKVELNTENIRVAGGEFIEKDMALAFDREAITDAIVQESLRFIERAKKALIFAIDIKHAEHIATELVMKGVRAFPVHSKMEEDRASIIRKFKAGKYDAIVNVNILTTGFDDPEIDLIILIRPTRSPVLHVQMIGRGLRVAPGKDECVVLDFAGNTKRLGPINDMVIKKKTPREGGGEPMVKTCPDCQTMCHLSARKCDHCDYIFPINHNLSTQADTQQIIATDRSIEHTVTEIRYKIHNKKNSPPSMKVEYQCGLRTFNEWICIQHHGYARAYARNWVKVRLEKSPNPPGNEDIINDMLTKVDILNEYSHLLAKPKMIAVKESGKYPNIIRYIF